MTKATKVKAIIFDLGRVLVDVDFSDLFNKYAFVKEKYNKLSFETVMQYPWFVEFSSGHCTFKTFYQNVKTFFGFDLTAEEFRGVWANVFKPLPEMENLLKIMAEQYPVGLLSDTDEVHWEYLTKNFPFLNIFTEPILSFRIKQMKPAALCYQKAASTVGHPLHECLFIDDRLSNVKGAIDAGMQAVQFKSYQRLVSFLEKNNIL